MFASHESLIQDRRAFLVAASAAAAGALVPTTSTAADRGVLLRPRPQNLVRVRIEMDVEGNVDVPKNPLVSRKSAVKLPIKSDAVFDYEERFRRLDGEAEHTATTAVERYYHEARSRSLINRNEQQMRLRESVRETVVRRDTLPEAIYAVDDYLQRGELELLRLPASSVAADELLPTEAVREGTRYQPSSAAMGSVLNLTSVAASDVTAEVVSLGQTNVKIQFRGKVDGSVDGVPTVIRTIGKMTFNRVVGTTTWLAIAVHETREIGNAEPGFDVAATVKMVRRPLSKTIALPKKPRPMDLGGPIPEDRLYVDLNSAQLGFNVLMNRDWHMMSDLPGSAMMRMIRNDRSIAQCDFRSLASLEPGTQWTLEAFQADVRRTLGEQLSDVIEADQRVSESGLRVLRVVARGTVEEVPIQWIVLHFSDDSGRRLLATFTMEGDRVATFAGSDIQLAGTLRFVPRAAATAAESASPEPESRVSKAIPDEDSDDKVQSASDLR